MIVALVIAVPIGAWVGHTGRGGFLVVGSANALRALPTLGVLILLVTPFGLSILGPLVALIVLAIPPILAGTYAGLRNVDPAVVDAARGMGMRGREVLWRVELPNALPLIIGGVRSAVLQVVSTATIAAYVGLGGLGRYIFDGLAQRDFPQMIGGLAPGRAARHRGRSPAGLVAEGHRLARPAGRPAQRPAPAARRAHQPSRRRPRGLSPSSPRAGGTRS